MVSYVKDMENVNCDEYDIYVKTEYDGKGNCGKLLRVSKKNCRKKKDSKTLKKINCKKAAYGEYCTYKQKCGEDSKSKKCYLKQYQK